MQINFATTGFATVSGRILRQSTISLLSFIAGLVLFFLSAKAQNTANLEWVQKYNGTDSIDNFSVAIDIHGFVYVAGYSYASGYSDADLIKYDTSGKLIWSKKYNGPGNGNDFFKAIAVDNNCNVYVVGSAEGNGTSSDMLLNKYDSLGNELWSVLYNGGLSPDQYDYANSLVIDDSGYVYITGISDYLITTVKYNTNGNKIWAVNYHGGDGGSEDAVKIRKDLSGNIYVAGFAFSQSAGVLIKYDSDGNELWVNTYNPNNAANVFFTDFIISEDGNICATAYVEENIAIVKYNATGTLLWSVVNSDGNMPSAIVTDNQNNIYVVGRAINANTGADLITLKYNSSGSLLWMDTYSESDQGKETATAITIDSFQNIYVAGTTYSDISGHDMQIIKYDSNGNIFWIATYNSPSNDVDWPYAIALDKKNNVYITGYSYNGYDFDFTTIKYSQLNCTLTADAGPDQTINPGESVQIGTSPAQGNTYSWSPAAGLDNPDTAEPIASPAATTSYVLTVSDSSGCLAYDTVIVSVNIIIPPPPTNNPISTLWSNSYPSDSLNSAGFAVDAHGCVFVCGVKQNIITGSTDIVTLKYSSQGNLLWYALFPNPGANLDNARPKIKAAPGCGVYVTFNYISTEDIYLVKYDSTGTQQWASAYDGTGNGPDYMEGIATDNSGHIYVCGSSLASSGSHDFVLVKYNGSGAQEWAVQYDGSGNSYDAATSVVPDNSGNVYVTGYTTNTNGYADYTTVKYNSSGVLQWAVNHDGSDNLNDGAFAVVIDNLGNVIVSGVSETNSDGYDMLTIKYDANGNEQWVRQFSSGLAKDDMFRALATNVNGDIIITGNIGIFDNSNSIKNPILMFSEAVVTIKYDAKGNEEWVKPEYQINSGNQISTRTVTGLAVDAAGNTYISGYSLFFNQLQPPCFFDYGVRFIVKKYSPQGTTAWSQTYPNAGGFQSDGTFLFRLGVAFGLAVPKEDEVYVTGGIASVAVSPGTPNNTGDLQFALTTVKFGPQAPPPPGSNNTNAIVLTSSDSCQPQSYQAADSSMWFRFTADEENVEIIVKNTSGNSQANIYKLTLYENICNNIFVIADTTATNGTDSLLVLSYSGLEIGNTYTLKIEKAPGGISDFDICIKNIVPCNLTADAGPDQTIFAGQSVQIGSVPVAGVTYSWSPVTGLSDPNIANPVANPNLITKYIVTLNNSSSCLSSDTVVITAIDPNDDDTVLFTIDKSLITTGILYDKVFHVSSMDKYNGSFDTVSTVSTWKNVYGELLQSFIGISPFPSYDDLSKKINELNNEMIVPVSIINVSYNRIKPYALDSNLLYFENGSLYDVPNRNQSPYSEEKLFIATAFVDKADSGMIKFYIGNDFYFTNESGQSVQINIDFDDGLGFRAVQLGDTLEVNYTNSYEKKIQVSVSSANKAYSSTVSVLSANCSASIWPATPLQLPWPQNSLASEPYQFSASIPYKGIKARGNAYVYYRKNILPGEQKKLKKPLIFVEGIDFGKDHFPLRNGDFGWCQFTGNDLDDYGMLAGMGGFADQLTAAGYDIIVLDFYDGADYMQRNAMLLVELMNRVNNPVYRVGDEQNVVLGASMGGQIAKYALAYMEKNNMHHCSRLYVSFDSPHQGANIPIGMQKMLDFLGNKAGVSQFKDPINNLLNREAAMQLLKIHFNQPTAKNYRDEWLNDLAAVGNYPQKLRKVAIANGSGNATRQRDNNGNLWNAGDEIFKWTLSGPCGGGLIQNEVFSLPGDPSTSLLFAGQFPKNNFSQLFTPFFCSNCLTCNAWVNTNLSFYTTKIYWAGSTTPYDNAPGGQRAVTKDTEKEINKNTIPGTGIHYNSQSLHDWQSFIPTISALDVNTTDVLLDVALLIPDNFSPDPANYPFDAYYIPDNNENQEHVKLTLNATGNKQWGYDQLLNSENKLQSPLNAQSLNNGVFNYGRKESNFLGNATIGNGGRLYINANKATDYGTGPVPGQGSTFSMQTTDCGSLVIIQSGGQMILGESSPNNKAVVRFLAGSKLIIRMGGKLIVNDNSSLVFEPGSDIVIDPGAEIQLAGKNSLIDVQATDVIFGLGSGEQVLITKAASVKGGKIKFAGGIFTLGSGSFLVNEDCTIELLSQVNLKYNKNAGMQLKGDDALLHIKGGLELGPGADFTFTYPGSSSGYVKFTKPFTTSPNVSTAAGSRMTFRGTTPSDKVLEIDGILYPPDNLEMFTLTAGYSYGGTMNLGCPARIVGAQTNSLLNVYGQKDLVINNTVFYNNVTGTLFAGGNKLTILSGTFEGGRLTTHGAGVKLTNTVFNQGGLWEADGLALGSDLINCKFNGADVAVNVSAAGSGYVKMDNTDINAQGTGVVGAIMEGGELVVRCGSVTGHSIYGFELHNYSILNMSTAMGGGYVNAGNNALTIFADAANDLYLDKGYNQLATADLLNKQSTCYSKNLPCYVAQGTLNYSCSGQANIDAFNNEWDLDFKPVTTKRYKLNRTFCPQKSITLSDNSPNTPVACGTFDNTPPCGKGPCKKSILEDCPPCISINTPDFIAEKLNNAIQKALAQMDTSKQGGHKKAVNLFGQIIKFPNKSPKTEERLLLSIAYRKMNEALASAIDQGQVTPDLNSAEVVLVMDVQQKLLQLAQASNAYTEQVMFALDRAQTFRLVNRRDLSLAELGQMAGWVTGADVAYIEKWRCLVQAEQDVLTGLVQREDFGNLLSACPAYKRMAADDKLPQGEKIAILAGTTGLALSPNPAAGKVKISVTLSGSESLTGLSVYDMSGKMVYNEYKLPQAYSPVYMQDVDVSGLMAGIYLVMVKTSEGIYTARLSVWNND
jgi:uncharacterized delta-60 repeat protein